MIRRPPRSTLFPTRRSSDLAMQWLCPGKPYSPRSRRAQSPFNETSAAKIPYRSEEHTSELQSQSNLVCRLLLEKKKKTITAFIEFNNAQIVEYMKCQTTCAA